MDHANCQNTVKVTGMNKTQISEVDNYFSLEYMIKGMENSVWYASYYKRSKLNLENEKYV